MSTTDMKALKIRRANAKRKLTVFENFLKKFDVEKDISILEMYLGEIVSVRESFAQIQEDLQINGEDNEEVESYSDDFEEKYREVYRSAKDLLSDHSSNRSRSSPSGDVESFPSNGSSNVISSASSLPKITLPSFSGSFDSWLGFHDLFNSLVNEDSRLPPIQKLFYLRGCLVGEAAEVISAIELSAENYPIAWELLKNRYDNRKIIRQSHTKSLLNIPCVSKEFTVRALLDHFQKHFRALKALGEPVESWNTILIVIIMEKFNYALRERWEEVSNDIPNPTIDDMIAFLQRRAQLEDTKSYQINANHPQSKDRKTYFNPRSNVRNQQSYCTTTTCNSCVHCAGEHDIKYCKKFAALSPSARYEAAKRDSMCINCLRKGHRATECSGGKCRTCGLKHHTLLHFENKQKIHKVQGKSESTESSQAVHPSSVNLHASVESETLLATAIVDIVSKTGKTRQCRVFLDAGSQAHFITEDTAQFLNLDRKSVNISVTGVDDISTHISHSSTATIRSKFSNFQKNAEFLIVPQITKNMPSIQINRTNLNIPKNIVLADPKFEEPSNIDALIGVKLFYKLLCVGQIALKNQPDAILQKTQLGWIIAGEIKHPGRTSNIQCHLSVNSNPADTNLTRFWEIEELPPKKLYSPEEILAENHFAVNTQRNSEGRYIVRLPFNDNKSQLGASHHLAVKRLQALEHRLSRDVGLKREYSNFLYEYRNLKHMSKREKHDPSGFYLPHHGVVKQDSLTTKLRVVFDGSAKTISGISLNDTLMVGPNIQDNLFSILCRFRSHQFALTADIENMYRQIRVHPDDACYQKILFRDEPGDPIEEYTLDTVTYGTSCASFLAIRSLQQLATDEGDQHPIAAEVLKRDFHVDDLLTGASTKHEAEFLRDELLALLKKGQFHLRKWASNDPSLVPDHLDTQEGAYLSLDLDSAIKTLGLQWNSRKDKTFYSVNITGHSKTVTKRTILSKISKLFDPLGLLGPVIVHAKIIIQLLWKAGVTWDESIPLEIHTLWSTYQDLLHLIEGLQFDRFILAARAVNIQLHGFCDASEKAYGACIYIRSIDELGKITVQLVCSKSRVAPVKSLSLPRLELCGALLLSRLFTSVNQALSIAFDAVYMWSDSTIALACINTQPHLLKTFVSNRISEIRRLTQSCHWRHVSSGENPADLVSRGQTPHEFTQARIWQHGPLWLKQESDTWPTGKIAIAELPEMKPLFPSQICMNIELNNESLLDKYSSFSKLQRIIAYIHRFINNIRNKSGKYCGQLSKSELDKSRKTILRVTQASAFNKEIKLLSNNESVHEKSRLIPLNPFIDGDGILRVGGRLSQATIPEDQRHPILLPPNHAVTRLIIHKEHLRLKHAGSQATLYAVRQKYWPLNGRNITRQVIHRCIPCFRVKPRGTDHAMGLLPRHRITPSRPFLNVGVDYCGPFYIKEKRFRNRNKIKVYVAVFVCMCTKAVHLELVSDLTTEAFLASLKRFFSRRGKSSAIYSDNATNFVAAKGKLSELHTLFTSESHSKILKRYCENEQISWHFIPPKSPHFGGFWEAALKSFKHHLLRTVGNALLTYEQIETFAIEIEAILNSLPLSPLSSDPNDLLPLTPGHFLIGEALTNLPEEDLTDIASNRLSSWQHAQHLKQHFWNRWHKEYLNQMICFNKRLPNANNIKVGTLVLIEEDHLPPLQWSLGRVVALHPGEDDVVRVVTLKTMSGQYKRCVKRLCALPLDK